MFKNTHTHPILPVSPKTTSVVPFEYILTTAESADSRTKHTHTRTRAHAHTRTRAHILPYLTNDISRYTAVIIINIVKYYGNTM